MTPPTCNPEPAHLLPRLAVLPHKEGVGGAAALQETPLVSLAQPDQEEEEEEVEEREGSSPPHH